MSWQTSMATSRCQPGSLAGACRRRPRVPQQQTRKPATGHRRPRRRGAAASRRAASRQCAQHEQRPVVRRPRDVLPRTRRVRSRPCCRGGLRALPERQGDRRRCCCQLAVTRSRPSPRLPPLSGPIAGSGHKPASTPRPTASGSTLTMACSITPRSRSLRTRSCGWQSPSAGPPGRERRGQPRHAPRSAF